MMYYYLYDRGEGKPTITVIIGTSGREKKEESLRPPPAGGREEKVTAHVYGAEL